MGTGPQTMNAPAASPASGGQPSAPYIADINFSGNMARIERIMLDGGVPMSKVREITELMLRGQSGEALAQLQGLGNIDVGDIVSRMQGAEAASQSAKAVSAAATTTASATPAPTENARADWWETPSSPAVASSSAMPTPDAAIPADPAAAIPGKKDDGSSTA